MLLGPSPSYADEIDSNSTVYIAPDHTVDGFDCSVQVLDGAQVVPHGEYESCGTTMPPGQE
jgi:hypothetical protein